MSEQAEARRLIESVFELPRARDAVKIASAAADAYERGDYRETAMLLSCGIDGADDPALAAHDVAAAGAVSVANQLAELVCRCGDENCNGSVEIEVRGEDVDTAHHSAVAMVNAASAEMFVLLTDMLHRFYQESTMDELCTLVMVLVSMRGQAAQLAARY